MMKLASASHSILNLDSHSISHVSSAAMLVVSYAYRGNSLYFGTLAPSVYTSVLSTASQTTDTFMKFVQKGLTDRQHTNTPTHRLTALASMCMSLPFEPRSGSRSRSLHRVAYVDVCVCCAMLQLLKPDQEVQQLIEEHDVALRLQVSCSYRALRSRHSLRRLQLVTKCVDCKDQIKLNAINRVTRVTDKMPACINLFTEPK